MLERVMTHQRKRVTTVLAALLAGTMLLWLFRSTQPLSARIIFVTVSILMAPLAYYGTYWLLGFNVRVNRISVRTLRRACGFFIFGAAGFIVVSALLAVVQGAQGSPAIAANTFAFAAVLGVMKAWGRHVAVKVPQ